MFDLLSKIQGENLTQRTILMVVNQLLKYGEFGIVLFDNFQVTERTRNRVTSKIVRGFESHRLRQKSTGFDLSIFYPLRKQWYIITRKRASHHRRCISSAAGCISFRNDDIQNFVLMICNSCGIDDIHGFAVIYVKVRNHTQKRYSHRKTLILSGFFLFLWAKI